MLLGVEEPCTIELRDRKAYTPDGRSVTMEALPALVDNFDFDRRTRRSKLLHLQDELHAALPVDAWREVLDVLNRKAETIAAKNISGA